MSRFSKVLSGFTLFFFPIFLNGSFEEIVKSKSPSKPVREFYTENHYQPLWFSGGKPSIAFRHAKEKLQSAAEEGLFYAYYAPYVQKAENQEISWQERDLWMTRAVLVYLRDLRKGRLRHSEKKRWKGHGGVKNIKELSMHVLSRQMQKDPTAEWLMTYSNKNEKYQQLKKELAIQKNLAQGAPWPKDLKVTRSLRKGMNHPEVSKLRRLLYLHGVTPENLPDTRKNNEYDVHVVSAVSIFQDSQGLKRDGFVGRRTRELLNMSPSERMKKIYIAMERWRWLPEELGERHIIVNIPWFELQMVQAGKIYDRMNIIIGKSYLRTPVFSTHIRGVRFNPVWNVPRSIALRKLKLIQKDPNYITRNGFRVIGAAGKSVDPESISWGKITRQTFSYRLKQNPGSKNALGRIRMLMHNPYRVYLHGTDVDSQKLFNYRNRSFSSGCIRLKDPARVAEFLFNDSGKWPLSSIEYVVSAGKTREENLAERVPVHVVYFTAWPVADGTVRFKPDLYGMDKGIWEVLRGAAT